MRIKIYDYVEFIPGIPVCIKKFINKTMKW